MAVTLRIPARILSVTSRLAINKAINQSKVRSLSASALRVNDNSYQLQNSLQSPAIPRPRTVSARNMSTEEIKSHPGRLANKVAVVTGSSAGIGRAIALAYAREGAKVVCSDLQPLAKVNIKDESHIATHDAIMKEGGIGVFVKCDVGEAHEVEELVHEAVEIFGRVDM